MTNPLLARFSDVPSLVGEALHEQFESALTAVFHHEHGQTFLSSHLSADDGGFWFAPDDWRSAYRPYVVQGGILHIPVKGVLLSDFPWALGSWATGYAYIVRALARGLNDQNVRGIALRCKTPGGEASECFEAAERIFAARSVKPIRAFAEAAYSAGYALASSASSIVVPATGGVGSIGVVMMHLDVSRAMEADGRKVTYVFKGKHKVDGNRFQPLPDDVRARWQGWVNEQGAVFDALVARNRGLPLKNVTATEADCYSASESIEVGLADVIAPLDDAITAFTLDPSAADETEGEAKMTTTAAAPAAFTQTALDAAKASGVTEGHATGKAEGTKEGMTAERSRISTILGSDEAKGRETLAKHLAFETDLSADSAKAMLAKAAKETAGDKPQTDPLSAAMSQVQNPQVGAGGGGDQSEEGKAAAMASSIVGLFTGKQPKAA